MLDWNGVVGLLRLMPGTRLRIENLHLKDFASKAPYTYSTSQPYMSVGVGMGVFPTINLSPNTTVRIVCV